MNELQTALLVAVQTAQKNVREVSLTLTCDRDASLFAAQTAEESERQLVSHEMAEWQKQKDIIRELLGSGPAIDFADDVSSCCKTDQFSLKQMHRRASWHPSSM